MVLLNIFQRQLRRKIVFFILCAILFTSGYILGYLYNSSLNVDTYKLDNPIKNSLLQKNIYFLVVIFTSPENFVRRQGIRQTWLLTKGNSSIKHYFALGSNSLSHKEITSLKQEHNSYKDLLILSSFRDSYSKLSEKLLHVLQWISENVNYKFLLKVDDDSFVHLEALLNVLQKMPQENLYLGFFDGNANVKTIGKWKEKRWFLCDRYLPYAKGGGYVLSQDLVQLIALISGHLTLYQNEDVSLGTWLAPFDVKRIHEPNFDTEFQSRGCLNSYLITHKQTISMMERMYKTLKTTGNICASEYKIRNSYVYNWNVPPSQCCSRSKDV